MTRSEKAAQTFKEGFSCSQAVFSAFSEGLGLERDKALRIGQPFGGGIAQQGGICGAVSGAFLVIGLKHGRTNADDDAAKMKTYALVEAFMDRFQSAHGSTVCRELLGVDISTPAGLEEGEDKGLFDSFCRTFQFIHGHEQIYEAAPLVQGQSLYELEWITQRGEHHVHGVVLNRVRIH